ncbi:MAG: acyltransferase family protein [Actinomycetes bacterium]
MGTRDAGRRSVYLDALRAVALLRVVAYHASTKWWITAATAMPLMFFVAGSLYAGSLDRRSATAVAKDRYRRILLPYWAYMAAMVGLWALLGVLGQLTPANWVGLAFPVLSLAGPKGPGAGTSLQLTWIALWYLQVHLLFSLFGGVLRTALRKVPTLLWALVGAGFAVGVATGNHDLANGFFFLGCWLVGYLHHDGKVQPVVDRHWKWLCALVGVPGALLFFGLSDEPRAVPVAAALLGVFWLTFALGVQPLVEPHLGGRRTRATVTWFARRSLTVYLWHMAAIYVAVALPLPGAGTSLGRLAWALVLTLAVVPVVGWVEDVAARRRPELWPGRTRPAPAGFGDTSPQMRGQTSPKPAGVDLTTAETVDLRNPAPALQEDAVDLRPADQPTGDA